MSYATITVPEFDDASSLNLTDWLWLTQGLLTDRNKKVTLQQLKEYFDNDFVGSPIGSIIAWLPGYFANGSNGTFTPVSITLPSNWKECDGSELNDSDSPIYNGSGRYLPNLTDDRFLMGDLLANAGDIGGDNDVPAHGITQPTFTYPNHKHRVADFYFSSSTYFMQFYLSDGTAEGPIVAGLKGSSGPDAVFRSYYDSSRIYYSKTDGGGSCTIGTNVALSNNHGLSTNLPKYLSVRYIQRIK